MSDGPRKRDDAGLLDALASYAADDDVAAVAAMSHEERARDLAAKGVDPEEVARRGRALAEKAAALMAARAKGSVPKAAASGPNVAAEATAVARAAAVYDLDAARPRKRPTYAPWLAAAAGLLLVAAAVAVLRGQDDRVAPREVPVPVDSAPGPEKATPSQIAASTLRDEANAAYQRGDYGASLNALDDAAKIDPAGDSAPLVRALREDVVRHLLTDGGGPDKKGKGR